jgi:hypothetical protein
VKDGVDECLRGAETALENPRLVRSGPSAASDRFARKIDDRICAVNIALPRTGLRVSGPFSEPHARH